MCNCCRTLPRIKIARPIFRSPTSPCFETSTFSPSRSFSPQSFISRPQNYRSLSQTVSSCRVPIQLRGQNGPINDTVDHSRTPQITFIPQCSPVYSLLPLLCRLCWLEQIPIQLSLVSICAPPLWESRVDFDTCIWKRCTGPGDSYKEGGNCLIQWDADTTGKWTDMQIELKTGDNYNMVPLKGLDSFPCARDAAHHAYNNSIFNSDHHD